MKNFNVNLFNVCQSKDDACREILSKHVKLKFQEDYASIVTSADPMYVVNNIAPRRSGANTTLLHYAALMPFSEFKELIDNIPEGKIDWTQGVEATEKVVYGTPEEGITPMGYAIRSRNLEYLEFLLKLGANIQKTVHFDAGYSPMQLALRLGNVEAARLLKEKGAHLNDIDKEGNSVLHLAIQSGNPDVVDFVLKNGENLHMTANYGKTPIHYLATCDSEKIIQMVLNHPTTKSLREVKDYFGNMPLDLAEKHHNMKLIAQLSLPWLERGTKEIKKAADLTQFSVLDKLAYFLKITNLGDPKSMPPGGHCNGFAFLYLYYCERGLREEFFQMLEMISSWDGDIAILSKKDPVANFTGDYKDVSNLFLLWANHLIWFHQKHLEQSLKELNPTQRSRQAQYAQIKKDEQAFFDLTPKFLFGSFERVDSMTEKQLAEYLEIISNIPGLSVEFGAGDHATSLRILEDNRLDYYDPNQPDKLAPFDSPKMLAAHIVNTKYRMIDQLNHNGTMDLNILYYPGKLKSKGVFAHRPEEWTQKSYAEYHQNSPSRLTPLHVAVITNDEVELKKLLKIEDVDLTGEDVQGVSALALAIQYDAKALIKLFCDIRSEAIVKHSDILMAAYKNNKEMLYYFLDNFKFQDSQGVLQKAIMDKDDVLVNKLLKVGVSVNEKSLTDDDAPLLHAIQSGLLENVKILMENGAILTGESFSFLSRNLDSAKFFIDHYPDKLMSVQTDAGETFLKYMLWGYRENQKEIFEHLKIKGLVDMQKLNAEKFLFRAIDANNQKLFDLLLTQVDLNYPNEEGKTPLMATLDPGWSANAEMAKALIKAGSDVTISEAKMGISPLHYAVVNCGNDLELIKSLIDAGAPTNHQTKSGKTPLHGAVIKQNKAAVELLLKAGADPTIKDLQSNTCFELAKKTSPEMLALITDFNAKPKGRKPAVAVAYKTRQEERSPIVSRGDVADELPKSDVTSKDSKQKTKKT